MKTKVLFISAALVVLSAGLLAQGNNPKNQTNDSNRGAYYVDADNNGKCDNFEKGNGGNNPKGDGVRLKDGSSIKCELVAYAIGIRPRLGLAKQAGLKVERPEGRTEASTSSLFAQVSPSSVQWRSYSTLP